MYVLFVWAIIDDSRHLPVWDWTVGIAKSFIEISDMNPLP